MTKLESSEKVHVMTDLAEADERRAVGCFEISGIDLGLPGLAKRRAPLPLSSVDISAKIVDRIAAVTVVQSYVNELTEPIEAVYIFPLAGSSSVSKFQMKVGERLIEGVVKERATARVEYPAAIAEGKRAAMLEQERDDVFTAQVGNIMPGEKITVTIVYNERLAYFENGHTEIRLPLVVAPRYMAGTPLERESVGDGIELDTDRVSDASRISPPRLAPGFDPKISLSLNVELDLVDGDQIVDMACSQHAYKTTFGQNKIGIKLAKDDEALDRDFVLSWKLDGSKMASRALVSSTDRGYGLVTIDPPALKGSSDDSNFADMSKVSVGRDVIFLLDRSGSMSGLKMASASRSLSILLNTLKSEDQFAICAFDSSFEWMENRKKRFHSASPKSIERGETYLRSIDARGGTEMEEALSQCFNQFDTLQNEAVKDHDPKKDRQPVIVLITDGEVGDESHILKNIQQRIGKTRIFSIGIDTAVNDGFLKRLAQLGAGTCTLVPPGDALEEALVQVSREIGKPLIYDLHIVESDSDNSAEPKLVTAPGRALDLFPGRPVTIFFHSATSKLPETITIAGKMADGGLFSEKIKLTPSDNSALPQLYARVRISELEDSMRLAADGQQFEDEIIKLSVTHNLLTRFTAFLAVDHAEVANATGEARKIVQPVAMPAQWEAGMPAAGGGMGSMARMASPALPSPASPPPAVPLNSMITDNFASAMAAPASPAPAKKDSAANNALKKEVAESSHITAATHQIRALKLTFDKLASILEQLLSGVQSWRQASSELNSVEMALLQMLERNALVQSNNDLQNLIAFQLLPVVQILANYAKSAVRGAQDSTEHQRDIEMCQVVFKQIEEALASIDSAVVAKPATDMFWRNNI